MNKQLIKKYKAEFDHWLEGGKVLVKYCESSEALKDHENWHEDEEVFDSNLDYLIIINDKYVNFRKALAEGKTIESQVSHSQCGAMSYPSTVNDINVTKWKKDTSGKFVGIVENYRIKPDEHKFKVGDFIYTDDERLGKVLAFESDRYHIEICDGSISNFSCTLDAVKMWKPQPGEWCWFWGCFDKVPKLAQFIDMRDKHFHVKTFCINGSGFYSNCEPFIGELPTCLKDTQ